MLRDLITRFVAFAAAISIVVIGGLSAHAHAPDKERVALEVTMLAMGATMEDLCLDGVPGSGHDCPLCHKLPTPPAIKETDCEEALITASAQASLVAQVGGHLRHDAGLSARAPPRHA